MSSSDSNLSGKTKSEILDSGRTIDSNGNVVSPWGHATDYRINQGNGKAETKPQGQG